MWLCFTWFVRGLLGVSLVLLANCTTLSEHSIKQHALVNSPYTMPANAYLALAKQQTGAEQQSLLIMAAGRLIQEGAWKQAEIILSQLNPVETRSLDEKKILQAKINRINEKPSAIISLLAQVHDVNQLPVYYQTEFHELLAEAYRLLNHHIESINERIQLATLLPDNVSKSNNLRALWRSLISLPNAELQALLLESNPQRMMYGWLELAHIARATFSQPEQLLQELEQWQTVHPGHPGNALLPPSLIEVRPLLHKPPRHIALLLPVTGLLAGPGLAIKDGFFAALQASDNVLSTNVRVYDTNHAAVDALYAQALQENADYIVGPLTKTDVALVAGLPHPVPTLLLNDVTIPLHTNAYQFGLSPTLEAHQVATKARQRGFSKALVITPEGIWGDEVAEAFSHQWRVFGGQISDTLHYPAHGDLNQAIRNALHIDASEARVKRIQQLLDNTIETTPRRRQDFDVIFLVAYPSMARQIKPLLNYYDAGDVPIFATSSVYSGTPNSAADRDLDGIIFSDMPWVFTHQMAQKHWPESFNSYNRLYALGMDSFRLSTELNQLLLFPALRNESGILYLGKNQQVARILLFAQFKQGLPVLMTSD